MENRQENNKKIIKYIEKYVEKFPELRFNQILWNCGLCVHDSSGVDLYYEESSKTLKRIGYYFILLKNIYLNILIL